MSHSSINSLGTVACVERGPKKACRVVIGLGNSGYTVNLAEQLALAGYEVTRAAGGEEARRQAVRRRAQVVIVPVVPGDVLATAKIAAAAPRKAKVVLVAPRPDAYAAVAAGFLGATFAAESEGVTKLVRAITGR